MKSYRIMYPALAALLMASAAAAELELDITSFARGGLIVHLGCGTAELTASLSAGEAYLVHGLTTDAAEVSKARAALRTKEIYGSRVSIDRYDGKALPYIDNLVNVVVLSTSEKGITKQEIARVLAPGGKVVSQVACALPGAKVERVGNWFVCEKAVPDMTDEWQHYLHGPDNNAVSKDQVVGPPRRMQWTAGPRYSRHHDKMSSVSAVVSSAGRIFSIIDEGPMWSIMTAPDWQLVARDAYNGKLLWKREIGKWEPHLRGLKSGPASLPRRLVAVGDRVYATLGLHAPVSEIDAASGETLKTYKGSEKTTEILFADGVLYFVAGGEEGGAWFNEQMRTLLAVKAESGEVLWKNDAWVVQGTLTVLGKDLYCFEKDKVTCRDAGTGRVRWQSPPIGRGKKYPSAYMPTLVATPDVIVISGGEAMASGNWGKWSTQGAKDTVSGLDAKTGKRLWNAHHGDSGYRSAEDIFVIDSKVWFSDSRNGHDPGFTYGLDLKTGKQVAKFAPDRDIYFFHHRCHRGKATEKYLMLSRVGIEYVDFRKEHWEMNHWVRGACLYGVIPANGLTYAPQHPCACYLETKLDGFSALAPGARAKTATIQPTQRLEKGEAYGAVKNTALSAAGDWTTYRRGNDRGGSTAMQLAAAGLNPLFSVDVGSRLTQPVVAGDTLVVSEPSAHAIHALHSGTGRELWTFVAGGRVDSAPTLHQGRVLFGCRDGYLYCLRLGDGKLAWRFRAAPQDERIVAYEQLESVWPLHGSVLVREGVAYAVAGRSNFLDGGVRFLRVDVKTGQLLSEMVMDGQQKNAEGKDHQDYVTWLNMPAGRTDILSEANGEVYMNSQPFSYDGQRAPLKAKAKGANADKGAPFPKQDPDKAHLFSATGFLDDTGWHRTYWLYGSDHYSGWAGYFTAGKVTPAGKILVADDEMVYGFGRLPQYWRWTTALEFHVFAARKDKAGKMTVAAGKRGKKPDSSPAVKSSGYEWTKRYPVLARAMVKAGDTLFIAGPRDVMEENRQGNPEAARKQVRAWNATDKAVMLALSAKDGAQLAEYELPGMPRFDGLIAARGRLYMSTTDGRIIALGK